MLLWAPGVALIAYQAWCAVLLLTKVPPVPKTKPSTRLGQLAAESRKPAKWVLVGLAGAVLSGAVGQALSAESNDELAYAFKLLAGVLLVAADGIIVYVAWVVGAAVWRAARDLQRQDALATSLPRFALPYPGALVSSWAALAMSPTILIAALLD